MIYMGSKRRIADEILPIILKDRKPKQWYVEPFCGGCNTLERVTGPRIAGDIHTELIAMYKALQQGWEPPKRITEEEYKRIMKNGSPELKGYAGFTHSFGGKYGSTYRRSKGRIKGGYRNIDYAGERAVHNIKNLTPNIIGVKFFNCSYYDLTIPKKSVIYCDPPYEGTSEYITSKFRSLNFWSWCRALKEDGHLVFISEYKAPDDFKCVWSKGVTTNLNAHINQAFKVTEKLFTL